MEHARPTVEKDSRACQERCEATKGCVTFSFWRDFKHCHLQDSNSTRQAYGYGFESGPSECTPGGATVTRTTTDPIPFNEECMQANLLWNPVMGMPQYLEGGREVVIQDCQKLCARTPGCAHFVVEFTQNMCRLASSGAEPYPGPVETVSGPPRCGGVYEELADFLLRKFGGEPHSTPSAGAAAGGRRWSAGTWVLAAASGFAILSSAALLVGVTARRRRGGGGDGGEWRAAGTLLLAEPAAE